MNTKESLHVTINNFCNNNCLFCLETEDVKRLKIPSLEEARIIFKKAKRKTDSVLFTGPEPTVNRSLIDYIKLANQLKFKEIRLVTNGRLLCYFDYAEELFKAGLTYIIVSLHGAKKVVHDGLTRTPGSFEQTVKACHNLSILKSSHRFTWEINITVNKINSADLFDFFHLASSFSGLDGIGFNPVIPVSRGLRYFRNLITNYTELADSFKLMIDRIDKEYSLKPENIFNSIGIVGLPVCLFRNYEKYVGGFEHILMNKSSLNRANEIDRMSRPKRIKRQACKACKYYTYCPGVWREYIKKIGWSEFQPID